MSKPTRTLSQGGKMLLVKKFKKQELSDQRRGKLDYKSEQAFDAFQVLPVFKNSWWPRTLP